MIVSILDSKNRLYQGLLFMAIIAAVIIPLVKNGIKVYIPEDSSEYYQHIANFISGLSVTWKSIILIAVYLFAGAGFIILGTGTGLIRRNQITFLLFLTLISLLALPESIGFHPPILSMIFLVPAISNIIRAGSARNPANTVFNAGFLLSLSSLLAFPVLFFIPAFFMVLAVFRLYKRVYWGMLSAGIFLPWFYAFLAGSIFELWPLSDIDSLVGIWFSNMIYFFQYIGSAFGFFHLLLLSSLIIFLVISFFSVYSRLDQMVFGVRYIYRALLWLGVPAIPILVFAGGMVIQYMLVFGFFLTIVGSSYLVGLKKRKWISVFLLVIVMLMISGHLLEL